ncbi:MAG: sugar ABC transporter ATP-binding protein [Acidimicrobiales bacterium]
MTDLMPVLEVGSLSKTFPGQVALSAANLTAYAGEVHALVGQNGSGKSTFIKILAGYHRPDPGAVVKIRGHEVDLESLGDEDRRHLHVMHQDLGLVPTMSIIENLALGRGFHTAVGGRIAWRAEARRARQLLAEFGVDIDPRRPVSTLAAAEKAIVALVRALQDWEEGDWGILVLDEPTASLPRPEVERLFAAVRTVAERGAAVIFVSHRLEEVFEIADRVTVLRDGVVVGHAMADELDHDSLVELIVGRAVESLYSRPSTAPGEAVLTVRDLWGEETEGVDFDVRKGEILGIAGLVGSGRDEIPSLLVGGSRRARGSVQIDGDTVDGEPRIALVSGMSLVPADRKTLATIPSHTIRENISLPRLGPLGRFWLSTRTERAEARAWIDRFELRPPDPDRPLSSLSGGNQQKAVLAKILRTNPAVMVLDEPTQGVDVGAKAAIYDILATTASDGTAIVLASSDAEELANVCDRVLITRNGRVAAELSGDDLNHDRIAREILA